MAPAHTMGRLTEPRFDLTVPRADTAFDHTGNAIARNGPRSRQPASITSPTTPWARADVASSSPK